MMNDFAKKKVQFKKSINFPCSYIDGNIERRLYINLNNQINNENLISSFIKNGFRRSYDSLYIPICENCNACISTRINIDKFKFSKRNKRVLKINKDLFLTKTTKKKLDQRFHLFNEYCSMRHGSSQMSKMNKDEFESFFYESKNKIEIYDLTDSSEKIFGSILIDILDDGYSAVYSFFNPFEKKRGLGNLLILKLITELKIIGKPYLYLGYWINNSKTMSYKSDFDNVEFFYNGEWVSKKVIKSQLYL